FTPDLNVMKAVAIAGGFGRQTDSDALSRAMAVNQAQKSIVDSQIEMFSITVNLARLKAEQEMAQSFDYVADDDEKNVTGHAEVIARAKTLFASRQKAFRTRLVKLESTLAARADEIDSYQSQIELQGEVLSITQAELTKWLKAKESGLVSDAWISQSIRDEQNVRAQSLQISTLQRQSQVNYTTVERQITDLIVNREVEINEAIQTSEDSLRRLSARTREDQVLLNAARAGQPDPQSGAPSYRLELYRDGEKLAGDVTYGSALNPGDTLFVILNNDASKPALPDK
ncbi:MAG: hypothetical protein WBC93_02815, partial [Sulfitobacter sp.]